MHTQRGHSHAVTWGTNMSRNRKTGIQVDRSKAAAWAWHQRGMNHPQLGGAALRIRRTCTTRYLQEACSMQRPSRFKREAAALLLQASPSSSALHDQHDHAAAAAMNTCSSSAHPDHDHAHHDLHDHPHPAAAAQLQVNPMILSPDQHFRCTSPTSCRTFWSSPPQSSVHPVADHYRYSDPTSPAHRRRSESLLRPMSDCDQTDKLFGITGRKSVSMTDDCGVDQETESLRSFSRRFSSQLNCGSAAAGDLSIHRSSLFDSYELRAVLKKLAYDDHQLALISAQDETPPGSPISQCDHHNATPAHCKQTLYDLLGWAGHHSSNKNSCSCARSEEDKCSSDHYFYCESPEINCGTKAKVRRWRRPSILMPHLPHSFTSALHHLPHSFSNALHHLPHSLSNALHQIAHLTHSLSSSHDRHNVASSPHRGSADNAGAASPARHQARIHRHLNPFHLSHILSSFKTHHTPPNPSCNAAFDSAIAAVATDCREALAPASVSINHHLKSSPTFDENLSTSNDYMLIYKMAKKYSDHGAHHVHHLHSHSHLHHHHYHHYHYTF